MAAVVLRSGFQPAGSGFSFLGALYLERVLRYSPLRTGLAFLPQSVLVGALSLLVVPRLAERITLKNLIIVGLILIAIGMLAMGRVSSHTEYVDGILPTMLLVGLGFSLVFMPSVSTAMSEVAPSESGLASAVTNVASQLGGSLSIAVLATITTTRASRLLAKHVAAGTALSDGYREGFDIAAAVTAATIVAVVVLMRARRPRSLPGEEAVTPLRPPTSEALA